MNIVTPMLWGWLVVASGMLLLWLVQLRTRNAGPVDVGWAAGIGLLAVLYAFWCDGDFARRVLVGVMGGLWSLRLAGFLAKRVSREAEDGRYQTLRAGWGRHAQHFFFVFYQAQALLSVLFAVPFLTAASTARPGLDAWDLLGLLIFLIAVVGESVADAQLAAFRREPANRGKTCRAGLWRYSRHPNYFFEWVHWFAYLPLAVGSGLWFLTLLGPALMLYFLFHVTGIPPTEAQALKSRGDDYRRYQQTTSVFIPWFPRSEQP